MPNILDWALQLMYISDQLFIVVSSSGMVATLVGSPQENNPFFQIAPGPFLSS
jgi:hypothetical protein